MIYKVEFMKKHIDLSRVVAISDAQFWENYYGKGSPSIGFEIECQLMDRPIVYERGLIHDSEVCWHDGNHLIAIREDIASRHPKMANHLVKHELAGNRGEVLCTIAAPSNFYEPGFFFDIGVEAFVCIHNLQQQIDELVEVWKKVKGEEGGTKVL